MPNQRQSVTRARDLASALPNDQRFEVGGVVGVVRRAVRAAAYVRVSTKGQDERGVSLEAQRQAIMGDVAGREGWSVEHWATDTASAASMRRRPGLARALELLDAGELDALVCARLDRLSRSVGDFASLMTRAQRRGWTVVVLDPPVDMSTPFGAAMAGMASVFAQLERDLIAQRTRAAIAERVRTGVYRGGRLANPPESSPLAVARILELKAEGVSLRGIAARLGLEGFVSPRGGAWSHTTVGRVLERAGAGVG